MLLLLKLLSSTAFNLCGIFESLRFCCVSVFTTLDLHYLSCLCHNYLHSTLIQYDDNLHSRNRSPSPLVRWLLFLQVLCFLSLLKRMVLTVSPLFTEPETGMKKNNITIHTKNYYFLYFFLCLQFHLSFNVS